MGAREQAYGMDFFAGKDDEAGVSFDDFITALQVWSWMRPGDQQATVEEAANLFGVTHDVIRNAVEAHYWMFLTGPDDEPAKQIIEHEGE